MYIYLRILAINSQETLEIIWFGNKAAFVAQKSRPHRARVCRLCCIMLCNQMQCE